ncbi:MAG: hypothetical protein ACXACE_16930 [Candidatus Thorarchaeota archaeon]|jgi:hypothetical protein
MKNEKFVDVNGAQVMDLTPDYERPLALVDLRIVKKLADFLPNTDLSSIRVDLKDQIIFAQSLSEIVDVCKEFVAFHETVNLIKEIQLVEDPRDQPEDPSYE